MRRHSLKFTTLEWRRTIRTLGDKRSTTQLTVRRTYRFSDKTVGSVRS